MKVNGSIVGAWNQLIYGTAFYLIDRIKSQTNIDNVRIRYYANEKADAYTTGLDLKVNGEFVKDLESAVS